MTDYRARDPRDQAAHYELAIDRENAEERVCPQCGAGVRQACINPATGAVYEPVGAHLKRLKESQ